MGMFDIVRIKCANCGETHEEQTKSGSCKGRTYSLDSAPPSTIPGLADDGGHIWCSHCNRPMRIRMINRPFYIVEVADRDSEAMEL